MRGEMVRMGRTRAHDGRRGGQARRPAGTTLVFVNSVCGCAAGNARPALRLALGHGVKPQQIVTVFAGQDLEATARARQFFADYAPSSPRWRCFAMAKSCTSSTGIRSRAGPRMTSRRISPPAFDKYCGATV